MIIVHFVWTLTVLDVNITMYILETLKRIGMATIKSYTDLEQSRKLAEILPLESADMVLLHEEPYETSDSMFDGLHQALCVPFSKYDKSWRQKYKNISYFPCWSLTSMLGVLPEIYGNPLNIERVKAEDGYDGYYYHIEYKGKILIPYSKNPIDACYEMILKLHELKML